MLAEFILTEKIQHFMADYGRAQNDGFPFFYPIWPYSSED